jgi:hypothetical protein
VTFLSSACGLLWGDNHGVVAVSLLLPIVTVGTARVESAGETFGRRSCRSYVLSCARASVLPFVIWAVPPGRPFFPFQFAALLLPSR